MADKNLPEAITKLTGRCNHKVGDVFNIAHGNLRKMENVGK